MAIYLGSKSYDLKLLIITHVHGEDDARQVVKLPVLVFWMSHIHWRRLHDKVEIPTHSVVRNMYKTCTDSSSSEAFESSEKLSKI